jgi:tRNA1(Val) A37 N6-methylase TrmN6
MTNPSAAAADPGPGETLDVLIGSWSILQLKGGHRFSTDDLLTGWRAAAVRPDARRCLDLGSGIGSVGLYLLGILARRGREDVTLVGVEAQPISHGLACRTIAGAGLEDRVRFVLGDLRDPDVLPLGDTFDLVTGSPPYVPVGKGLISPHPQRAACRVELRGSIFDYCVAARPRIAPGGRFVYVMAARDARTEQGPVAAGLLIEHRLDVVFREGDAPMIAVVTCARPEDGPVDRTDEVLVVRRRDGRHTDDYAAIRADLGFPPERPR